MRALLIGPNQTLNSELAAGLGEFSDVQLLREIELYPEPDDLMRLIRARRPDVLFIAVDVLN